MISTLVAKRADLRQLSCFALQMVLVLFKQLAQLRYGHRLTRCQQRTFDNLNQTRFCHVIPTLP